MPIVRVASVEAGGGLVLDPEFTPPCLGIVASPWLCSFVNEVQGRLKAIAETVAPGYGAYGWTGLRIERRDQLDDGIAAMLETPGPVLVDCRVAKLANCFPMIPSGAAHTA